MKQHHAQNNLLLYSPPTPRDSHTKLMSFLLQEHFEVDLQRTNRVSTPRISPISLILRLTWSRVRYEERMVDLPKFEFMKHSRMQDAKDPNLALLTIQPNVYRCRVAWEECWICPSLHQPPSHSLAFLLTKTDP